MPASFTNGPAAGITLNIRRCPVFLRVVGQRAGCSTLWDALDQLEDTARPGEDVYVYRLIKQPASVHIDGVRNGRRFGEWSQVGSYELIPGPQPEDAVVRDNSRWREWCRDQANDRLPAWAKGAVMPKGPTCQ